VGIISKFCICIARSCGRIKLPKKINRNAAKLAISSIRIYQKFASAKTGRCCFFKVSCSEVAATALKEVGWNDGWAKAIQQLERCGGAFTLAVTASGEALLITSDGAVFQHNEISSRFLFLNNKPDSSKSF
jgi:putative component of membrane protein insertase Oxa1/YidC/SpoIIIJ protein YidD